MCVCVCVCVQDNCEIRLHAFTYYTSTRTHTYANSFGCYVRLKSASSFFSCKCICFVIWCPVIVQVNWYLFFRLLSCVFLSFFSQWSWLAQQYQCVTIDLLNGHRTLPASQQSEQTSYPHSAQCQFSLPVLCRSNLAQRSQKNPE